MAIRRLGLNARLNKKRKDRAEKSGKGNETFRQQMLRRPAESEARLDALEAGQTPKLKRKS